MTTRGYSFETNPNPFRRGPLTGDIVRAQNASTGGNWLRGYGNPNYGGYVNPQTGAGTLSDKSEHGYFLPKYWETSEQLEAMYGQSWACKKFIDIPVDDQFAKWRVITGMPVPSIERFVDGEAELELMDKLPMAMKAGRLFGTGLMALMTDEASPESPLVVNNIRPGEFRNLLVFDRFHVSVDYQDKDRDPWSKNYGKYSHYIFHPVDGQDIRIHHSRVIRFEGMGALTSRGWEIYRREWGLPEITPVLLSIMQDAATATGAAHLAQMASIPVIKLGNLRDAWSGDNPDPDEVSPEDMAIAVNNAMSIFRMMLLDAQDDFDRSNYSFAGLPELLNMFSMRLAAAADIPATRFMGRSPAGMNATGESDMLNYVIAVANLQARQLPRPLRLIDQVLARHVGVSALRLKYHWPTLLEISEQEQANVAKTRAEALDIMHKAQAMNTNEIRASADGDVLFGNLPPIDETEEQRRIDAMQPTPEPVQFPELNRTAAPPSRN